MPPASSVNTLLTSKVENGAAPVVKKEQRENVPRDFDDDPDTAGMDKDQLINYLKQQLELSREAFQQLVEDVTDQLATSNLKVAQAEADKAQINLELNHLQVKFEIQARACRKFEIQARTCSELEKNNSKLYAGINNVQNKQPSINF